MGLCVYELMGILIGGFWMVLGLTKKHPPKSPFKGGLLLLIPPFEGGQGGMLECKNSNKLLLAHQTSTY